MKGIGDIMKQAQEMQAKLADVQQQPSPRTIDIDIAAFRFRSQLGKEGGRGFEKKPFAKRSLSLPFSFETARLWRRRLFGVKTMSGLRNSRFICRRSTWK